MEFPVARPDAIRAINQRWLINFWKQLLADERVPRWQRFTNDKLAHVSPNLALFDVKPFPQGPRFLIRFHGAAIREAYGGIDCRDRFLDEIVPMPRAVDSHSAYRQVVTDGRPVYTIQDLNDRNGRIVHYERLLLPFASDGNNVDRILASFEFVCLDGAFEARDLMRTQTKPPSLRFRATIDVSPEQTVTP